MTRTLLTKIPQIKDLRILVLQIKILVTMIHPIPAPRTRVRMIRTLEAVIPEATAAIPATVVLETAEAILETAILEAAIEALEMITVPAAMIPQVPALLQRQKVLSSPAWRQDGLELHMQRNFH